MADQEPAGHVPGAVRPCERRDPQLGSRGGVVGDGGEVVVVRVVRALSGHEDPRAVGAHAECEPVVRCVVRPTVGPDPQLAARRGVVGDGHVAARGGERVAGHEHPGPVWAHRHAVPLVTARGRGVVVDGRPDVLPGRRVVGRGHEVLAVDFVTPAGHVHLRAVRAHRHPPRPIDVAVGEGAVVHGHPEGPVRDPGGAVRPGHGGRRGQERQESEQGRHDRPSDANPILSATALRDHSPNDVRVASNCQSRIRRAFWSSAHGRHSRAIALRIGSRRHV